MARRSSARLRGRDSSTPKRVSLSHDAPTTRTPRTLPAKLPSLDESDEMPGAFPQSASPVPSFALNPVVPTYPSLPEAVTPTKATPIKPSSQEMHPQLHHQTTAKPRDEARHLGFSNMAPHTEPPKHTSKIATLQGTPTRARNALAGDVRSPGYQFTFRPEQRYSLELSPDAKKLMQEKREEAARIREQMVARGEGLPSVEEAMARRIAKPKGRFSQAHVKEFEKMDSIANHHSAFRLKPTAASSTPSKYKVPPKVETAKSLKRSPSKAGLDEASSTPSRLSSRDHEKALPITNPHSVSRSTSFKDLEQVASANMISPTKRIKRAETDDVSATRPGSNDGDKPLPSTPQMHRHVSTKTSSSNLAHLSTPTQSSLARAASIKSVKTSKIPAPSFTPAKGPVAPAHKPHAPSEEGHAPHTLLGRSPSKASLFSKPQKLVDNPSAPMSPLLARSPSKPSMPKTSVAVDAAAAPKVSAPPLLARTPLKGAATKPATFGSAQEKKIPSIPFLGRSPMKLPISNVESEPNETPGKDASSKSPGRFNLLRRSPVKSILRSPQRLYSDDPSKVAAGTHMATPPRPVPNTKKNLPAAPPVTMAVPKHVDFTSSTKAREEKRSCSPSKTPTPSPNADVIAYPDLLADAAVLSPSPQKRRQTSGPSDFTFRAGDQAIVFGPSPKAQGTISSGNRRSTIRMVTSDLVASPATVVGSKKRKFDFENKPVINEEVVDKENTPVVENEDEQRPTKRVKASSQSPVRAKSAVLSSTAANTAKRATPGVKPKGTRSPVKRPTISQARLNSLAQPKQR